MIEVRLADSSDDAQIRRLLWETPMRGIVDLVFAREPNYFALANTQGKVVQTLVVGQNQQVVGLATRAIRRTRVNGIAVDTGYLADFRLHPKVRGGYLLIKGYKSFLQLHADAPVPVYTALLVEDNSAALSTLVSGRANMPSCRDLGRVLTPLILISKNPAPSVELERGSDDTLPEIVAALNRNDRQFAPVYSIEDFTNGRFPGFSINDFIIIRRGGDIVGVAGLWVQTNLRQTIALEYTSIKKLIRPLLNLMFGLGLPPPGKAFKSAYMSFVECDNAEDYEFLIKACIQIAKGRGIMHLVAGVHENDSRSHILSKFTAIRFAGRLFSVNIDGDVDLDNRVPYVELATL